MRGPPPGRAFRARGPLRRALFPARAHSRRPPRERFPVHLSALHLARPEEQLPLASHWPVRGLPANDTVTDIQSCILLLDLELSGDLKGLRASNQHLVL